MEYAFVFERPVIFIDVPKKILNPDADELLIEPIETSIREKIGHVISANDLEEIPKILDNLDNDSEIFKNELKPIRQNTVFNISNSSKIGAKYIQKIINDKT